MRTLLAVTLFVASLVGAQIVPTERQRCGSTDADGGWRPVVNLAVIASTHLDPALGRSDAAESPRCKDSALQGAFAVADCGSTNALLAKALAEAENLAPDALIVIGSLSAAYQPLPGTAAALEQYSTLIGAANVNQTAFPTVAIAVGSHDFPGLAANTFTIDPQGAVGANTQALHLIDRSLGALLPWNAPAQPDTGRNWTSDQETFLRLGAYSVSLPRGIPIVIISINSAIFVADLQPENADYYAELDQDSLMNEQMAWLDQQLSLVAASRKFAVIIGEAAFGMDVGDEYRKNDPRPQWASAASDAFRALLDKHCKTIVALVFAELFSAQMRVLSGSHCDTPMVTVAGLAPLRHNNPAITHIALGLCENAITQWTQKSVPLWQNSSAVENGLRLPAVLPTERASPAFTLQQDMAKYYGGTTVAIVESTLTTLLPRARANDFASLQAAAAGGAPPSTWSFGEQRATLCAQMYSGKNAFAKCAAMCDPLSSAWSANGWNEFPPPMLFEPAPWIVFLLVVAAAMLCWMPFGLVIQWLRARDLLLCARQIADAAPDAARVVESSWIRVHGSSRRAARLAGTLRQRETSTLTGSMSGTLHETTASLVTDEAGQPTSFLVVDTPAAALPAAGNTNASSQSAGVTNASGTLRRDDSAALNNTQNLGGTARYYRIDTRDAETGSARTPSWSGTRAWRPSMTGTRGSGASSCTTGRGGWRSPASRAAAMTA
jgi:hypothetical protein